ncbi:MAG: MFS transporter [Prolixibacteraceae bacterium]|nr:MFS transporter [Prolixibacteraceae bacterium]
MSKVPFKEKIGFSLGEYSSSIVWQTLMYFLPIFYTDTFGLTAGAVATMFFVVRIFDAFTDPVMGMISDRTNTRWGKYRPFILWLALPFGAGAVLMFTTPELAGSAKLVYAYITYSVMMVIYTAIMIPYNSLIGVISPNPDERTAVSSYKFVFAYAAGFSVQLLLMPLVAKLGAGNDAKGYQMAMLIFASISVVFLLISFASVRERVKTKKEQQSKIREDLSDLIKNRPWVILFALSLVTLIYVAIRSADIAYYFKYVLDKEQESGKFMAIGTAFVLLGVMPTKWLSAKIGKRNLYIICMAVITVSSLVFYVARPNQMWLIYTAQIIFSFASGPTMPLLWSMLADSADYSEWKNNRRATGLVYSAATFAQKAGFSLGGAIVMVIISMYGFVANQVQTELAITGIKLSLSVVPAAVSFLGIILLFFYPLNDKKVKEIEQELIERKNFEKIKQ